MDKKLYIPTGLVIKATSARTEQFKQRMDLNKINPALKLSDLISVAEAAGLYIDIHIVPNAND